MRKDTERTVFRLGNLEAKPGERVQGFLELAGGSIQLPAAVLHGREPGKTVLVTAGIHAGEYVGIQSAIELANKLKIEKIVGTVIIIKVVNRPAFEGRNGSMGLTDGKNLNRVFPGNPEGTEMERLAWAIAREVQPAADYYIDLHCGDDYEQLTPYVYYAGKASEEVAAQSRRMAEQVDVPYMVKSNVSSGGSYNYAASQGIPSILIERGGMGAWNPAEVQADRRDVRNLLIELGVYIGAKDARAYHPAELEDVRYQYAFQGGCWYPYKKPGDTFEEGEILGEVKDYEGNVLEVCEAEYAGVILYQTGTLQVLADGPMIAYGRAAQKKDDRKERIARYWGKRSMSFMWQRKAELQSPLAGRWMQEITSQIPSGKELKILDVGCGSGFFSILLAEQGHEVTGTDLAQEMVDCSGQLAREFAVDCRFLKMDAEHLEFPDETFDVVISRNLTWTLPHAEQAYREWSRVLKKDGVLLNFDANYGATDFSDTKGLPENHTHRKLGDDMMRECEEIQRQLPISACVRPAWDLETLSRLNMQKFFIDTGISRRIYTDKDEFYNPTPMFLICARKAAE